MHSTRGYWISIKGSELTDSDKKLLECPHVTGVILFDENLTDKSGDMLTRMSQLIKDMQSLRGRKNQLAIAIDHEGAFVNRFQRALRREGIDRDQLSLTEDLKICLNFPSLQELSKKTVSEQTTIYRDQAIVLRKYGITHILGPCIDVHSNQSPIIGARRRAFSDRQEQIIEHAKIYIDTFSKEGVQCCLKHFPEHGYSTGDSHLGLFSTGLLPSKRLGDTLYKCIEKYLQIIKQTDCELVMFGHLLHKVNNEEICTTFSRELRSLLPKSAVSITDCLSMGAMSGYSIQERLIHSAKAGHDILMLTHQDPQVTLSLINEVERVLVQNLSKSDMKDMSNLNISKNTAV